MQNQKTKAGIFVFFIAVMLGWSQPGFADLTGTLDTTFGTGGEVITDVTDGILSTEEAEAVVVQADGEIVVVGETSNLSLETDIVLVRYDTDGSLDTTFGTGGEVVIDTGSTEEIANDVALEADGDIIVAGTDGENILVISTNTDGSLDTTFGEDGIVTIDVSDGQDSATAIAIQDDGQVVVVGVASEGSGTEDIVVIRLDTDGSLDTTFGGDGIVTTDLGSGDVAAGVVIDDTDGEIFVVGTSDMQLAVVAYETDGDLDVTFSTDSILLTDLDTIQASANAVFLEPDDTLLIAGFVENANGTETDAVLVRLNEDGSLDATFGTGGVVETDLAPGSDDQFTAVTVTADGNIIAAGDAVPVDATTNTDLVVVEYDDSGTLVADFGTAGTETTDVSGTADIVNDIALETNGEIVVVGGTNVGANERFVVELINTDGTLDTDFNGTGVAATHVETGLVETAADVAIEEDDGIVVAGSVTDGDTSLLVVVNYEADGSLDTTFSDDGIVTLDTATHQDVGEAVAIQSDGNIVVAGTDGADMLVVRYDTNGDLDVTFGDDGIVTIDTSSGGVDMANAIVIQPDGEIVIGGVSDDGGTEDFAVVRLDTDGSLDTTFNTDGIVTTDLGETTTETIAGLGLESNGDIVAAGTSGDTIAVVSYTSDGELDTSFSADGILLADVGAVSLGNDVTITADDQILVAGAVQSDGDLDAALVAFNNNGSLVTSFGDDGVATYDLSADNDDQFTTLLVEEDDGTIVAGGDPIDPDSVDNEAFDLVQFNADGRVDTTFGTNGLETIDFGTGNDSVNAIAEQSNGEMISVGISEDVVTSDEFFGVAATGTTGSSSGCSCNFNAKPSPMQSVPQIFMSAMLGAIWLLLRLKASNHCFK